MGNKSSTSGQSKKAGKSLKEKRAAKAVKKAAQTEARKAWDKQLGGECAIEDQRSSVLRVRSAGQHRVARHRQATTDLRIQFSTGQAGSHRAARWHPMHWFGHRPKTGQRHWPPTMLRFAWRWAQVGDRVLVHDREHLERDLMNGVVAVVKRVNHDTSIGIKVDDNGETRWLWPTPLFVHPNPLDPDESCWICQENAAPSPPLTPSPTKEVTV